jgi:hypothetical protein
MRSTRPFLVGVLCVVLLVGACGDDDSDTTEPTTTSAVTSTSTPTSTSGGPTTAAPTTVAPTTTAPGTTTTRAPAARPAEAPVPTASAGGGSGEVSLRWHAVPGASGYRVQRAASPQGPFEVAADVDVVSGHTTLATGVTNLWSPAADQFEYIEVIGAASVRYLRVLAYNDGGEGPVSETVCAAPPGGPDCASDAAR